MILCMCSTNVHKNIQKTFSKKRSIKSTITETAETSHFEWSNKNYYFVSTDSFPWPLLCFFDLFRKTLFEWMEYNREKEFVFIYKPILRTQFYIGFVSMAKNLNFFFNLQKWISNFILHSCLHIGMIIMILLKVKKK